ncbi:MAG TPA: TIGR03013 family XrtA/PEP-CTERM system glycosyltransferase [Myxococcaceae bacterium]|nr:TIGR03013 family XrtA/PEP-CTERM system glycosyltransferase [Myxococcaceae bacterium]
MLRVFHHWLSARKLIFFLMEASAIGVGALAGASAGVVTTAAADRPFALFEALPPLAMLAIAFAAALQFALYALDLYDLRVAGEDRPRGGRLLKAAGCAALVLGAATMALPHLLPGGAVMGGAMGAMAGALCARTLMGGVFAEPRRVLVIGTGQRARAVAAAVVDQGDDVFEVTGLVDPREVSGPSSHPLEQLAAEHRASFVVVACDEQRGVLGPEALLRCRIRGIPVYDAAAFCERVLRRIPILLLRASDLAYADELVVTAARRWLKRALDVAMASVLLLCAAPVMILLALLIKLDSRGPLFYRQERVGLGGRAFRLWKFRSMRVDAEKDGAVWARLNDDRVTRVGRFIRKTRMDEIPQVFNVLVGDMSFVGPRPERPVFVQQLAQVVPFYRLREAVKPGITGWAQIRYPYGASVEDARNKLEFDLYYVKNGSLFLDMAIIFHTVRHVLLGRGAR